MSKNFYITTPIYYVNDVPHIGSAYTTLVCDVVSRYERAMGSEVYFLTGTDEHGQKIQNSAKKKGIAEKEFVDDVSKAFISLCEVMNYSNNDFIRTTSDRHKKGAIAFWKILEEKGYIYKGEYAGWYSVRDECFYADDELVDGKAPTGTEVEWVAEESYFFKLSAMQNKLLEYFDKNPDFIFPEFRMNEVRNFVEGGLRDLSISRTSFDWGVPVPGDEKHVMYVWLDALTNYINALGFPDQESENYKKFWPANMHVVGKDITRFHAIYWPAFLLAAELPIPKKIVSHGWWLIEGEKMSKSIGNVISPRDLVEEYGLDETRYYLMREIVFGQDGNFSRDTLKNRINGELANKIGNLIQRTLTMVFKNCDGKIPNVSDEDIKDIYNSRLLKFAIHTFENYKNKFISKEYHNVLAEVILLADQANEYIDKEAPWVLRKTDPKKMELVLYSLCEVIRHIAILLNPFLPASSKKILKLLGIDLDEVKFDLLSIKHTIVPSSAIPKPEIIFRKID